MIRWGVLVFLLLNAGLDLRTRKVSVVLSAVGGLAAVAVRLWQRASLPEIAAGAAVGLLLLAASRITRGKIGSGDGIVVLAMGLGLGLLPTLLLVTGGLLLAAAAGIGLLLFKGADKNTAMPFIPFLAAAYIGGMVLR